MNRNKSLIFFLLFLAFGFSLSFLNTSKQSHKGPENPGWTEQFLEMKNPQPGTNYSLLRKSWAEQDKLYKKNNNVLNYISEIGPNDVGGRVRALMIDYSDTAHLFAGGVSGGLWVSENGGQTWNPVSDHNISLAITCITQNPFNPKEIYYGTGESTGNSAAIDGAGVFKSIDGGKTFTQLFASTSISSFATIWDIEFSKTDSSTFYVGTRSGGLYRTNNSGNSFQQIFATSVDVHEILTYSDSTIWAAVYGNGIYSAKEQTSMKFTLMKGVLPASGIGRVSMSYSKNYPKVAFCQFTNTGSVALLGTYKTSDHGKTWKKLTSPTLTGMYSWAWYCLNSNISPTDTNFMVATSVDAAYSIDGGTSWRKLSNSHADFHSSDFYPAGNSYLIGNDGGVYKFVKSTSSSTRISLNNGLNITQFYTGALNRNYSNVFMGGTQDNHTLYYNGSSFNDILGGDGSYCAFSSTAPFYVYASYQNGEIRRMSSNFGGQTNIKPSGAYNFWFINPFIINPFEGNQMFFLTKNKILVSSNSGSTWADLTNSLNKTVLSIGASNEKDPTIYFGGGGAALYRANNAGTKTKNEKDLTSTSPSNAKGSTINDIKVNYTNPSTVYLAMSDINTKPRIWKLNGAKGDSCKWINISGDMPVSLPVNCIEVNPQDSNIILAGTDFGLYSTLNGGITWVKEMGIPNVVIYKIYSHPRDGSIFIFTHGRGVFKSQFKNFIVSVKHINGEESKIKVGINNPVEDILNIKLETKDISFNTMAYVYNSSGKMVESFSVTEGQKYDVSRLGHGVYILRVISDNGSSTQKFLKL